jgi:hypothetical protein
LTRHWTDQLSRHRDGRPRPTLGNVLLAIHHDETLRADGSHAGLLRLRLELERRHGLVAGHALLRDATQVFSGEGRSRRSEPEQATRSPRSEHAIKEELLHKEDQLLRALCSLTEFGCYLQGCLRNTQQGLARCGLRRSDSSCPSSITLLQFRGDYDELRRDSELDRALADARVRMDKSL